MTDYVLEWMKKNNVPITRESYLDLAWGSELPDPWTPEHEAELPEELQFTVDDGVQLELDFEEARVTRAAPGTYSPHGGEFAPKGSPYERWQRAHPEPPRDMIEVSARAFVESRDVSTRQQFLSPHPAEELSKHTLLMNRDGTVGISVDPHGDVQNVFNNGGPKGGAAKAMTAAIAHGGRTLDCYDGFLPSYYGQFGFKEVQRMHFNPQFAPPGWDFAKYDNPDIVFMAWGGYDEGGAKGAIERAASRENWIKVERAKDYGDDWDAAKSASRAAAVGGGEAVRPAAPRAAWPPPEPAGSTPGPGASASLGGAVSGAEEKLLLVSEQPRAEQYEKWDAQIEAYQKEIEAKGEIGSDQDTSLYQMRAALVEYREHVAHIEPKELEANPDRVGLNVVYGGPHDADETKILAAALTRFNPRQSVARITLSGAMDPDAHIKALQQVVKRYAGKAERIEGQVWGSDLDKVIAYEKAGFKISGTTDLGLTRLVYGKEGPTSAEIEAEERVKAARKAEVAKLATEAATKLDFDPNLVRFTDEDRTFKLNNRDYHYAGSYTRGDNSVLVYNQNVDLKTVAGITAHEIGHRKLDALRATYRDQYDDMLKDPGPPPDPQGKYWWQQRGGHDAVMSPDGTLRAPYDKKYPIYDAWERNVNLKQDKLRKDDGVTDYSKEYWEGFEKGDVQIDSAYHETIAEMTRLKFEKGETTGSQDWQKLFRMVEDHWSKMTPTERLAKRPLKESSW